MVSEKCTFQLSRSSTLESEAAIPPSAITVCAFPKRDLQINPTETPCADASMAARSPAPPAPMTSTSYLYVSYADIFCFYEPGLGSIKLLASHLYFLIAYSSY